MNTNWHELERIETNFNFVQTVLVFVRGKFKSKLKKAIEQIKLNICILKNDYNLDYLNAII